MADAIAVEFLTDGDKATLAARWRKNRRELWDATLTEDENHARVERLLARLEGRPFPPGRDVLSAMSGWEVSWRMLMFVVLAMFAAPPAWWMASVLGAFVLVGAVIVFLQARATSWLARYLENRFFST